MTKAFTTAKRKNKPIYFELDGESFSYKPEKMASMVMPVLDADEGDEEIEAMRAQLNWLFNGLSDKQAETIKSRLLSKTDDLDYDGVTEIIEYLQEEVTGTPTT